MSDWNAAYQQGYHAGGIELNETAPVSLMERAHDRALDSELEAAIEYKIATAGMDGVTHILDLMSEALRRQVHTITDKAA